MLNLNPEYVEKTITELINKQKETLGEEELLNSLKKDSFIFLSIVFNKENKNPIIDFSLSKTEGYGWFIMPDISESFTLNDLKKLLIDQVNDFVSDSKYLHFLRPDKSLASPYHKDWGYLYIDYRLGEKSLEECIDDSIYESLIEIGYGDKLTDLNGEKEPKEILKIAAAHLERHQLDELMEKLELV